MCTPGWRSLLYNKILAAYQFHLRFSYSDSAVAQSGEDLQKRGRRSAIEETIVRAGSITFRDVAGLTEAKQALTEAIIMPLHFPQLFTG